MANVGFRVFKKVNRTPRELVEKFRGIPVANIGDVVNRIACLDARIRPLNKVPLLGTAITVRVRSGDNAMMHYALDLAEPGDVIVVEGQGDLANSLAGENMANWSIRRGHAGWVIDGALRDVEALAGMPIPFYAAGAQPNGPYKNGPGEVNVPISCGGVIVNPGDLIAGDADGVIVIPRQDAEAVLQKALKKQEQEAASAKAIQDGSWDRSAYTEAALSKMGCEFIDDYYR
ncbi:RraA family protein [Pigmentiphaga soli]|uniref:Putative 4-hydroxy-4-methyl-2-oxoglutarate aldolase n=1 Tax=Pigmentiphaga soli TaxID=1007095 RepID=A0ABP8GLI3_9BURK